MSIYSIIIQNDEQAMTLALQQARYSMFTSTPNPRVGCIIVKNTQIIGAGHTQPIGGNHAELEALKDAKTQAKDVRNSTVYVTLEPCSHFGLNPPCTHALIQAGVHKVVMAIIDPNPLVSGQGLQTLKAAGIIIVCGILKMQAYELNIGFFKRMQYGIPWIRLKSAASLDGKTSLYNGQSKWITSQVARNDGHFWRARACAVVTGIGTIQNDNPKLNVRAIPTTRQPRRIVIDSKLSLLPTSKILDGGGTWIFTASEDRTKTAILEDHGAEIIILPDDNNKVHLLNMIKELGKRQLNEIHIEAGNKLNTSFIREACVNELLLYLAPSLLGEALGIFSLPILNNLCDRWMLYFHDIQKIGEDLRILARFK